MNIKKIMIIAGIIISLTMGTGGHVIKLSSPTSTCVGDTFTVNVSIDLNESVQAVAFDLLFDPSVFTALSVEGDLINASCTAAGGTPFFAPDAPDINNTAGKIYFAETCLGASITGAGNAALITFNSISAGAGSISLQNIKLLKVINKTLYNRPYIFDGPSNKTITVKICDLNNDGIIVRDYNDLIAAYKCFLGIGKSCAGVTPKGWKNIKEEYECFVGIN